MSLANYHTPQLTGTYGSIFGSLLALATETDNIVIQTILPCFKEIALDNLIQIHRELIARNVKYGVLEAVRIQTMQELKLEAGPFPDGTDQIFQGIHDEVNQAIKEHLL